MILVDSSVWIDHLRHNDEILCELLDQGQVCIHSLIIGELACGNLKNREQLITLWKNLPHIAEASHDESLFCIDQHSLMGRGIGFVDVHLIASTLLTPGTLLWTRDRRLSVVAESLQIHWSAEH